MNQKNLRYPLIIALVLVWGLIVYRIAQNAGHDDIVRSTTISQNKIDYNQIVDTYILVGNYPDPFIPANESNEITDILKASAEISHPLDPVTAQPPPKALFDPSVIQYSGMISNPQKRIKVAILVIGGKEYTVKERQWANDYLVKKVEKDKVTIVYKGVAYTITMNK